MISSEVQRTLVKSPPELWAELSDPAALARHLGELGEIRITRIDPEQKVEWEADNTSGTVQLKPSGWGTKVTLAVSREVPAPAPTVEIEAEPVVTEPTVEPEPRAELAVLGEPPEPELQLLPRRGFFARLFRRRREEEVLEVEPQQPEAAESAAGVEHQDEETVEALEETPDISAELKAAEEVATEQVTAVLTSVLDRLGAAHHRPFSRS
jgi:hypothetical protein